MSQFAKSMEIWKENIQGSLASKNLKVLEVEECSSLEYIFSVSMASELVQLTDLKVKNCPTMEYIIKKEAEETAIDTLPLPRLKIIKLESCSELTSFCAGSITMQCPSLIRIEVDNCPKVYAMAIPREVGGGEKTPFFNDKVLCAHLQVLKLSSTNIQKLWPDKPHRAIPSNVQNLHVLTVKGCHKLEYLFPSFLIKDFVVLFHLSLYNCENMEQVIFTEDEGITGNYLFSRIQQLHLVSLPKLGRFCHGNNSETEDPALFNEKVQFPRLNRLIIADMGNCRKIWQDKVSMGSFYALTFLEVKNCERLSNILPFRMVERLQRLETLRICKCGSLEEIIGPDDDGRLDSNESHSVTSTKSIELQSRIKFLFSKVRELNLRMLPKLKGFYKMHTTEWPSLEQLEVTECSKLETLAREYINFGETQGKRQPLFWVTEVMECEKLMNPVPTSVSFKHLTTLKVSKCHGFRNLVTFTIAKSMVQLKTMSVTNCQMIEEIIASTTDGVTDVIVFGQLESLELDSLPCLSRFFSGNYGLVFPKLEEVIIRQCRKMEFFTMGELWTPMLHGLQSTKGKYEGRWEGDLNATIQQFCIEKVFPSSEDLELSSINIQRAWNHKLLATRSYARNLTCLIIYGCHNLNCLFSSTMVKSFVQLKKLNIENCENVENVIIVEGSTKEEMNRKLFRLLEFLVLKDLPKLTRFCHGNYFEFPLLTSLRIESCPTLKTFVSGAQGITAEIASPTLFDGKVAFPCLEELTIMGVGNWRKIWQKQPTTCTRIHFENY